MGYNGLHTVISGGQDGADHGALFAARSHHVKTAGHAPKGFRTTRGSNLSLGTVYGLLETNTVSYAPRTKLNVKNSDATIRFASDFTTKGEVLTLNYILAEKKPYCDVALDGSVTKWIDAVESFIVENNIRILNVAGNRDFNDDDYHFNSVRIILGGALARLKEQNLLITIND